MTAAEPHGPRLSRWEIIGAWLHIWTPPRGVEVPPVPVRKLAVGAALLALIAVGIYLLAAPDVEHSKQRYAAHLSAAQRAAVRAEKRRLAADQRLHTVHARPGPARSLTRKLERAILRDAQARVRAHTLNGPIASASCQPAGPTAVAFPGSKVFKCMALGPETNGVRAGFGFVATVFPQTGELSWCKTNPSAGEGSSFQRLATVRLSKRCAGTLAGLLAGQPG